MADYKTLLSGLTDENGPLVVPIMETVGGTAKYIDITQTPHILLGGTTGSGKSGVMNVMLSTIVGRAEPEEVVIDLLDPKRVELSLYRGARQVRSVTTNMDDSAQLVESLAAEMDQRYELLEREQVRSVEEYYDKTGRSLPYHLLAVDELGDLMMTHKSTVLPALARIGQLGRAAGFHMLLATQRPAAEVVPKLLLANVPSRIALKVQSHTESRLILNEKGAENLKGKGDMFLQLAGESGISRGQAPFLGVEEVRAIVAANTDPDLIAADEDDDEAYEAALADEVEEAEEEADLAPKAEPKATPKAEPKAERTAYDDMGRDGLRDVVDQLVKVIELQRDGLKAAQAPVEHAPIDTSADPELWERIIKLEGENSKLNAENAVLFQEDKHHRAEIKRLSAELGKAEMRAERVEYELGEARGVAGQVHTVRTEGVSAGFAMAMLFVVAIVAATIGIMVPDPYAGPLAVGAGAIISMVLPLRAHRNAQVNNGGAEKWATSTS